jgi:hypothetical protein
LGKFRIWEEGFGVFLEAFTYIVEIVKLLLFEGTFEKIRVVLKDE